VIQIHTLSETSIVCTPSGSLDWVDAVSLRHVIHNCLQSGAELTIDLRRVPVVDAAGLGAIIGSLRWARAVGATVELRNVRPRVRWRLDLLGADRMTGAPLSGYRQGAAS
jgi:anti-anti-sigma factor